MTLGLLQGPAELLPVSSSGHLVLVPHLLRWPYVELDPEVRKSFEVAVHLGTAAALAVTARPELLALGRPREAARLGLTAAPAALLALAFERPIERRLGTLRGTALAQIAAGLALWLADRRAPSHDRAGTLDHGGVGIAQALALVPGVSRAGAAMTALRLAGLDRPAAARLSRLAALPLSFGAGALKGWRAVRGGVPEALRPAFAVGGVAAFAAAVSAMPLARSLERGGSLAPFAAYRVALGAVALAASRRQRPGRHASPGLAGRCD